MTVLPTAVKADPDADRRQTRPRPLTAPGQHGGSQGAGRHDGAIRIVGCRARHAEDGHDLVADEFVDEAARRLDRPRGAAAELGEERCDIARR